MLSAVPFACASQAVGLVQAAHVPRLEGAGAGIRWAHMHDGSPRQLLRIAKFNAFLLPVRTYVILHTLSHDDITHSITEATKKWLRSNTHWIENIQIYAACN